MAWTPTQTWVVKVSFSKRESMSEGLENEESLPSLGRPSKMRESGAPETQVAVCWGRDRERRRSREQWTLSGASIRYPS